MFPEYWSEISAFFQIVLIDLAMSAENAVVVGMAAAGLPAEKRHKAVFLGIVAATVLRIVFAVFAVQLLGIIGLVLAGGLLLLWVAWKMYRQLRNPFQSESAPMTEGTSVEVPRKTMREAITQIVVADVSMSLDNVLGVAGAARDHVWVLVVGLALSVLLMGLAATAVVKLLHRFRWIAFVGFLVVLYVALSMIWEGGHQVWARMG